METEMETKMETEMEIDIKSDVEYETAISPTALRSEMLITLLRERHLYRNPPSGDFIKPEQWEDWRDWVAMYEPFTPTEVELLNNHADELIERYYPALASQIEEEIDDYADIFISDEKPRRLRAIVPQLVVTSAD